MGLLLDSLEQERWVAAMLSGLLASPAVEIALVVVNAAPPDPAPTARPGLAERARGWSRNRHYLLHALYERFDRWRFPVDDDPLALTSVAALLDGIPTVEVAPRQTKHCDYFTDADVATVRSFDLDVAIRLGFRILKGDALRIARHGVWSYHHGDNRVNRGGPPGFWEVMEGQAVTGSMLQVLTEELDAGRVLYRSYSSTHHISVNKNRASYYWKSATFLQRKLEQLFRDGPEGLAAERADEERWEAYSERLYVKPTNREMLRCLARLTWRYAVAKVQSLVLREQWFVAYRMAPAREADTAGGAPASSYHRFTRLLPPRDRFWADPFPVAHAGRHYLFVEELPYATDRGRIVYFEIDATGAAHGPRVALERDYHLSYPFVFAWNGTQYMVPETEQSGRVELYRAVSFPDRWELDRVLLDLAAVDATLAEIDGRWWMFANVAPPRTSSCDELHVYHADSPLGPWTPHAMNPVKSDVRSARPAGRVFTWRGRHYRPAQDCALRYGHAMVVHEIVRLTPTEYVERPVTRIEPRWAPGLLATHTLNAAGRLTAIDGQRWIRRW